MSGAPGNGTDYQQWLELNLNRGPFRTRWKPFLQSWDVLITPVTSPTAFPHDHGEPMSRTLQVNGEDRSYWELPGNLAYFFKVEASSSLAPYAGGGLNIAHKSKEFDDGRSASDTDLGLNLLGGTLFGRGKVNPFVELRVELAGGEQFVLTGGVLF